MRPFTWRVPYTPDNVPRATVAVEVEIETDDQYPPPKADPVEEVEWSIDVLNDQELDCVSVYTPSSCLPPI